MCSQTDISLVYVFPLKSFLTRDKGQEVETLDKLLKTRNIPTGQHDAFKTGFADGFIKAQALSQRTQGLTPLLECVGVCVCVCVCVVVCVCVGGCVCVCVCVCVCECVHECLRAVHLSVIIFSWEGISIVLCICLW